MGAFVALLPAVASSETSPTVEAVEPGLYKHAWSPKQVTVGTGGAIMIRNPSATPHGVHWVGGPDTPACSSGVPVGTTEVASGAEWSGTCTFAQAGTYTFYCTVHGPEMTETVTVSAGGTTTTTTTTTPTGTTPTGTVPGSPVELPAGTALIHSASLASIQRGGTVHGTVAVAGAGGRLQVDLLATGVSLGKPHHPTRVRVGRLVREAVSAGEASFRVRLDAAARRALKRHRRLALVVRITLTPPHGTPSSITRTVVEHG
jgi:plastocyanin